MKDNLLCSLVQKHLKGLYSSYWTWHLIAIQCQQQQTFEGGGQEMGLTSFRYFPVWLIGPPLFPPEECTCNPIWSWAHILLAQDLRALPPGETVEQWCFGRWSNLSQVGKKPSTSMSIAKTTIRDGCSTALNFNTAYNVAFIAILLERWMNYDGRLELYEVSADGRVIPLRLLRLQEHPRK